MRQLTDNVEFFNWIDDQGAVTVTRISQHHWEYTNSNGVVIAERRRVQLSEYPATEVMKYYVEMDSEHSQETFCGFPLIMRQDHTYDAEDYPGSRAEMYLVAVGDASTEALEAAVEDGRPAEHCQHAHDCCGQWYQSCARIERHGKVAIVTLPFYCNV